MVFFLILIVIIIIAIIIKYYSEYNDKNKISKIFVINLKTRPERLSFFNSKYNLNIPFEVFYAIDGSTLNLQKLIENNIIGGIGIKTGDVITIPQKIETLTKDKNNGHK